MAQPLLSPVAVTLVRLVSVRLAIAAAALVLMPLTASAAGQGGRFAKMDRALKAAAVSSHPSDQRVIVQTRSAEARAAVKRALLAHGDVIEAEHPALNALTVVVHGGDLASLDLDANVTDLSSDAEVTVTGLKPAKATKNTRAAAARKANRSARSRFATPDLLPSTLRQTLGVDDLPYTGAGVGVAVVDSGIDPNADLSGQIAGFWDFTHGGVYTQAYDDYGHGTHVAGLIASSGWLSKGQFRGVAPSVRLLGFKVLDKNGRGRSSNVLRAIDFIVANKALLGVDVINLSLGHPVLEPAATDPLVQAIERAVRAGIVVVAAAGNVGADSQGTIGYAGIASPGNAPSALTVGAVETHKTARHDDDRIAWFSSRGPTWFDGTAKPDLVAPGVALISDAPSTAQLYTAYPALLTSAKNGVKRFAVLSGTSMAAAVATGGVALALEAGRSRFAAPLTPNTVKALLEYSALPVLDDNGDEADGLSQGAGEMNPIGATYLAASIDPSMPLGRPWLTRGFVPATAIGGDVEPWSQEIIWNSRDIANSNVLDSHAPIFDRAIVWGASRFDSDNIVWGTAADADNIVWGTNIVWATNLVYTDRVVGAFNGERSAVVWGMVSNSDGDNIVWGTFVKDGDNIVWGTFRDADNIVWGTLRADDDNIVWGTMQSDSDNIVWGTLSKADTDNIVWGTLLKLQEGMR